MFKKTISLILSISLILTHPVFAQGVAELNIGKYLSQMPALNTDSFRPPHLRYISYDIKSNDFKLLLDQGDAKLSNPPNSSTPKPQDATQELFNYFLIGLSLPNDKFWVNLRPDAPQQIIDPLLEKTDMGKIMLEADLQLKKDTAGLTSPQNPEGKEYWDKLYKKAGALFGTENITIPTITRPWIVPGEVIIRESEDSAYIYKANLKVMLEEDYLTGRGGSRTAPTYQQYTFSDPRLKELNKYSTELIKELILPRLTQEINTSKKYAQLRQVFFSLILSRWFKDKYQGSSVGNGLKPFPTIDSGDLTNLTSKDPWSKDYYFSEYKKSFQQGEYDLKKQVSTPTGQVIRSYVSGGVNVTGEAASPLIGGGYKVIKTTLYVFLLTSLGFLSVPGNVALAKTSLEIEDERALLPGKYLWTGQGIRSLIIDGIGEKILRKSRIHLLAELYDKKYNKKELKTLEDLYMWAVEIEKSNPGISKEIKDKINKLEEEIRLIFNTRSKDISKILDTFKYKLAQQPRAEDMDVGFLPEELKRGFAEALRNIEKRPDILLDWIDEAVTRIREAPGKERSARENLKMSPFSEKFETLFWDTELGLRNERLRIIKDIYQSLDKGSSPLTPEEGASSAITRFREIIDQTINILNGIYQKTEFKAALKDLENIRMSLEKDENNGERVKILFDIVNIMYEAYLETPEELEEQLMNNYEGVWEYLYIAADKGRFINAQNSIVKIKRFIPKAINSIQGKPEALQQIRQYVDFRETKEGIIVDNIKHIGEAIIILKNIFASKGDDEALELDELLLEDVWLSAIMRNYDTVSRSSEVKASDKNKVYLGVFYKDRKNWLDLKEPIYGYQVTRQISQIEFFSSSAIVQELSDLAIKTTLEQETGGIDFTRINYLTRPMGSFQGLDLRLPRLSKRELEGIDINKELASVKQMINARIDVSTDRLKRLLAAMSQKDAFTSQRETQLLPLLLRLCWLKEEKGAETAPDFRAVLLIADTGLFVEQGNTKYSLN